MKVLLIPRKQIEGIVSMGEIMGAVEEAFRSKGLKKAQMPPKLYVNFPGGDFRSMPCYVPELGLGCIKVVSVHPNNPAIYGLPSVIATIILIDPESGRPLAVMDGTWITGMRTGAAGGIAAKYLARGGSRVVGMVGAGVQARTQLMALNEVLNIEEVRVFAKTVEECERFREDMTDLGLRIEVEERIEKAVADCDVLVTTTPVTRPIVKDEWVSEGTHINAIGADAPGKEELEPGILKRAKVVVDDLEQACHSGEVNVPLSKGLIKREDIYGELGEIIVGKKVGRTSEKEITVFDSTGLAIEDLAAAAVVYKRAKEANLGAEIDLL
jgi:alanine dehydrogenase